jgi:transposase
MNKRRQGAMMVPTHVTTEQRRVAKLELIKAVQQGVTAKVARDRSEVLMHRTTVYRLLKRMQREGEGAWIDGRHGHPVKLRGEVLVLVREHCQANPCVSSSAVQLLLQEHFGMCISVSQLNRVRASLGLTRNPPAREKKAQKRLG